MFYPDDRCIRDPILPAHHLRSDRPLDRGDPQVPSNQQCYCLDRPVPLYAVRRPLWTPLASDHFQCLQRLLLPRRHGSPPAVPPGSANSPRAVQIGFTATTWTHNFSFSVACGPLSWIIPAEVFSTATRSRGVFLATMASIAMNTMTGQVTPKAMDDVGLRYYILFVSTPSSTHAEKVLIPNWIGHLQLHQRRFLLGTPPGDQQGPSGGHGQPVGKCALVRAHHASQGLPCGA